MTEPNCRVSSMNIREFFAIQLTPFCMEMSDVDHGIVTAVRLADRLIEELNKEQK